MSSVRAIEIDFDVHKAIEASRISFAESPNDVLRKLLGIGTATPGLANPAVGKAWTGKGVTLPHGTLVRMEYNGREYRGEIGDGQWVIEGTTYANPSPAASAVGRTKAGKKTQLDGWKYWQVKRPGDERYIDIASLRPEFIEAQRLAIEEIDREINVLVASQ